MSHYIFEDISTYKQRWKKKLNAMNNDNSNNELFCIYIANPFCINKCKFCIYGSTKVDESPANYKKYYDDFLVKNITDFEDVLQIRTPDTVYFGGGTASLIPLNAMDKIFNAIPNFKQITHKYIEIHPAHFSLEKLNKLIDYGFTYLSFGIQTIDINILSEYNRKVFNTERLLKYIDEAKKHNIIVSCDLMAFLHDDLEKDTEAFKKSLSWVLEILQPSVVVVYPYYKKIFKIPFDEQEKEHNYLFGYSLRKNILEILKSNPQYKYCPKHLLSLNRDDILAHSKYDYFLFNMEEEEFFKIKKYFCSSPPNVPLNQNVLSFGGFQQQKPYSYISNDRCWFNINNNWKIEYQWA